jgi:hypothetical protein
MGSACWWCATIQISFGNGISCVGVWPTWLREKVMELVEKKAM